MVIESLCVHQDPGRQRLTLPENRSNAPIPRRARAPAGSNPDRETDRCARQDQVPRPRWRCRSPGTP